MVNIEELGTVIATPDGPSVSSFSFVMDSVVRQGEFVSVKTKDGNLLAVVDTIHKSNKYFESAGAVREYNRASDIRSTFPVGEWEHTVATCRALGVYFQDKPSQRSAYPPAPGAKVTTVDDDNLNKFLGLDQENGLDMGEIFGRELRAKIRLGGLVEKHFAVLAMTGAGKSYTTSVLIEEFLLRARGKGRVALVVLDTHGEYVYFAKSEMKEKVTIVNAEDVKINISRLNGGMYSKIFPQDDTLKQSMLLDKVVSLLRELGAPYSMRALIDRINQTDGESPQTKGALLRRLKYMDKLGIFSSADFPSIAREVEPGKALIINLRSLTHDTKKKLIVEHLSRTLFNLRIKNQVPAYLQILEEAHNFCPRGEEGQYAIARPILRKVATEGRKFGANLCVISQRPGRVDTTVLSQCNTHIIMRVTNPTDLDQIKQSAESITSSVLREITSLRVGEARLVGSAVNYPILVRVRKRKIVPEAELSYEERLRQYEKQAKSLAGADDFV